jgi:hypothetical protein
MNVVVYVAIGWLTMAFWTAVSARFTLGHVVPDAAVVTLVFVALRREPIPFTLTAVALGYFAGRQALAPMGLHEAVLVACALTVYLTAGNLAGSGAGFFALASGGTVMLYHLLLYVLARTVGGHAGFTGWATAMLVPSGAATAVLALVSHPLLSAIERRLSPDKREELSWH